MDLEFYLAWGAVAFLVLFSVGFVVWANVHSRRVRKAMTPKQREEDDRDHDAFMQVW